MRAAGHDLTGRTVLITGAAGGLGTELARALRQRGAHLALLDLDGDRASALAAALGDSPDDERVARGWAADVGDLQQLTTVMAEARAHFGHLDVVVAGAGVLGQVATLSAVDADDWDRVVDINLSGVWRTFKAALPHVSEREGHLVALSSLIAFVHPPLLSSYAASKAGVLALCDSLRLELQDVGVAVTSVHPAIFRTPLIEGGMASPAAVELVHGFTGMWETVPVEQVAADVVRALERRPTRVVTPRRLVGAQYVAGLAQALAARTEFTASAVRRAVELGSSPRVTRSADPGPTSTPTSTPTPAART